MDRGDDAGRIHIRLDPLGGIAGDMFVAALLDALPELEEAVGAALDGLGLGLRHALPAHHDGTMVGRRFLLGAAEIEAPGGPDAHRHHPSPDPDRVGTGNGHGHPHGHPHRAWREIRALLRDAPLTAAVAHRATAIFEALARAEARVHGVEPEAVTFHEVGALDSIGDVVAAAALAAALDGSGGASWSVSPIPLGSGRVRTAHGPLPVPAPATALLLRGFETFEDGFPGERVTPTGAAILRHLCPRGSAPPGPRVLERTGIGFGQRTIPGLSNCLRVLVSREAARPAARPGHRALAVVEFEVDDRSPEDLGAGLDRIRAVAGVHDVTQFPGTGKKGRQILHVRVLAAPEARDRTIEACFAQTTTIGLRHHAVSGAALARTVETVAVDGRPVRVKCVERPGGRRTAKAEMDDVAGGGDRSDRARLRRRAEDAALARRSGEAEERPGPAGGGGA